jgi:alkanesulfonate monooxygenase SsuD/methylene tetrahydromethanopterin reductase-like flavin-dependent oxidoreductase (luciferase family)
LILPRAVNDKLKIWVAVGGTPESVVRAARYGLPVIFAIIGGNPAQFKPLFEYYKEKYKHYGHSMDAFEVGVHVHAFFGEDSKKMAEEYYPVYASQMTRIGRSRGWPPYQRQQFDAGRTLKGHLIVGDAGEAIEKILYLHELFGLTRFSAHVDVGGPSHAALMKTIEIFGTKVAPKVREALNKPA